MGMIKLPKDAVTHFESNCSEIFESGNLAEGRWNRHVAEWASEYTNAPHAHAVNSNGAGIVSLLTILKHYHGKKRVFLQSNTMYGVRTMSIASGMELCGYVDCSLGYLMPTYEQVEAFIRRLDKPSECVFVITHIGGWINPDIVEIAELCKREGIALIEDCAHSLGATLGGLHSGLFGDAGVYSLYSTKAVPAGEGGIVITDNMDLHEQLAKYSIYDRFDQKLDVGVNNRMSEINALLAYSVLLCCEEIIENKQEIGRRYMQACDQYGWQYIHPTRGHQNSNLYKFILLSNSADPVAEFAAIDSRTSPVYDYSLGVDVEGISSRHICLPVWYGLEDSIVDGVLRQLVR